MKVELHAIARDAARVADLDNSVVEGFLLQAAVSLLEPASTAGLVRFAGTSVNAEGELSIGGLVVRVPESPMVLGLGLVAGGQMISLFDKRCWTRAAAKSTPVLQRDSVALAKLLLRGLTGMVDRRCDEIIDNPEGLFFSDGYWKTIVSGAANQDEITFDEALTCAPRDQVRLGARILTSRAGVAARSTLWCLEALASLEPRGC